MIPQSVEENRRIVVVDGLCNLCSGLVRFIGGNDRSRHFRFAWGQGEEGKTILEWCGMDPNSFGTMICIEEGKPYFKSTGVLRVARLLRFPWNILFAAVIIPPFIRDWIYDLISRNRNRIFGMRENCPVPDEDMKQRFL